MSIQGITFTARGREVISNQFIPEIITFDIYRNSPTEPSSPSGGSYNVTTKSWASLPTNWTQTRTIGNTGQLRYVSTATITSVSTSNVTTDIVYTAPVRDELTGSDGVNGRGVIRAWNQLATEPVTPTGGTINTAPLGWTYDRSTLTSNAAIYESSNIINPDNTLGTWQTPVIVTGSAGTDGVDGFSPVVTDTDEGARIVDGSGTVVIIPDPPEYAEGIIYFSMAQTSAPDTPTATDYNFTTGVFTGLTTNWQTQPVRILITRTDLNFWSVRFRANKASNAQVATIEFDSPIASVNFGADIQSDNFVQGEEGWRIRRELGDAEFASAVIRNMLAIGGNLQGSIINGASITGTRGHFTTLTADNFIPSTTVRLTNDTAGHQTFFNITPRTGTGTITVGGSAITPEQFIAENNTSATGNAANARYFDDLVAFRMSINSPTGNFTDLSGTNIASPRLNITTSNGTARIFPFATSGITRSSLAGGDPEGDIVTTYADAASASNGNGAELINNSNFYLISRHRAIVDNGTRTPPPINTTRPATDQERMIDQTTQEDTTDSVSQTVATSSANTGQFFGSTNPNQGSFSMLSQEYTLGDATANNAGRLNITFDLSVALQFSNHTNFEIRFFAAVVPGNASISNQNGFYNPIGLSPISFTSSTFTLPLGSTTIVDQFTGAGTASGRPNNNHIDNTGVTNTNPQQWRWQRSFNNIVVPGGASDTYKIYIYGGIGVATGSNSVTTRNKSFTGTVTSRENVTRRVVGPAFDVPITVQPDPVETGGWTSRDSATSGHPDVTFEELEVAGLVRHTGNGAITVSLDNSISSGGGTLNNPTYNYETYTYNFAPSGSAAGQVAASDGSYPRTEIRNRLDSTVYDSTVPPST